MMLLLLSLLSSVFLSESLAAYCKSSYACSGTCYSSEKYHTSCGFWNWGSCTKYRQKSSSCRKICYRDVCCYGYQGSGCSTPICFGTTRCPNGGTCVRPDMCSCRKGFASPRCNDINECVSGASNCQQVCLNTHGSYRCSCRDGFKLLSDGISCFDIDECRHNNGGCQQKCSNQQGGYSCACNTGYILNADNITCSDADECRAATSGCQHGCINTIGSFICTCPTGYVLSVNQKTCEDEDECTRNSSICMHYCQNTPGSYKCTCLKGYTLSSDGRTCTGINLCAKNNGGCQQLCSSSFGSLQCSCKAGFILNNDNQSCSDVDECKRIPPVCDHDCINTNGSFQCSCHAGYALSQDRRSCSNINDCKGVICQNGGTCMDGINAHSCSCKLGFTGRICERDIDECINLNGGCEDLCQNTFGSFKCSCKKGRTLNSDNVTCSGGTNTNDVFTTHDILDKLLPKGCHYIHLFRCAVGHNLDVQLSSTSHWYQGIHNKALDITKGIVFININELSLPFSLAGAEVFKNKSAFSISYNLHNETLNMSHPVDNTKSSHCLSVDFDKSEMFDFMKAGSFLNSLFKSVVKVFPEWIRMKHINGSIVRFQDLKTDILFGSSIDYIQNCKGAPVLLDHAYSVFQFGSEFSLSLYGKNITIPKQMRGQKFCLLVDICHDYGGSAFLMVPEESRDVLLQFEIFQTLQKSNLKIRPRGIGVSLVKHINVSYRQRQLMLWNGDRLFQYSIPDRANLWIGGDIQYTPLVFEIASKADIYLSVPRLDKILEAVFYEEWNALVRVQSKGGLKFNFGVFGNHFTIRIPLAHAEVDAFMSVGGQDKRTWCGDLSNPPGIFLTTRVDVNPFIDVPILRDLVFDFSAEVYAFLMTDPGSQVSTDMSINIFDDLIAVRNITSDLKQLLIRLIHKVGSFLSNSLNVVVQDLSRKLNAIQMIITDVLTALTNLRFQDVPNFISKLWSNISNFDDMLHNLEKELRQQYNSTIQDIKQFIDHEVENFKARVSNVIYKLKSQIVTALKNFNGFGLKFRAELTVFELSLGLIDQEIVYSNENLLQCSRFDSIKKLLQGKPALRSLGRFTGYKRLCPFIRIKGGLVIGYAIARDSQEVVVQMNAFVSMLGIQVTGDIFLTRNGITIYVEGNVWDVFYAQLDIHAGVGKQWHELEFSVRGRFSVNARKKRQTQTDAKSFQGSFLDGLRKIISMIADGAKKRLSQAQTALTVAQDKLTRAQDWLEEKKHDVRGANKYFDNAVKSMDIAKRKLEEAKGPFKRAIQKLNSAQRKVENLCRIKTCGKVCIPGLKCRICWKKVWFMKIPLPCCHFTSCMISFPNPICLLANAGCAVIRALAFAALEVAKVFVRIPMVALDVAKLAVSAAQVIVDKSRVVLKVAEGALEVAKLGLEAVKGGLEVAKFALEAVKIAIGAAAKVFDFVIRIGLQSIIDVRNCRFYVKLSTVDLAVFDVSCEINAFKLGWRNFEIRINFKNIVESIWNAAKATINAIMDSLGDVFTGRRKREVTFAVSSKLHGVIGKLRSSRDSLNLTNENETINVVRDTMGFEKDTTTDHEQRASIFETKCRIMKRHIGFLIDTLETLNNVSTESMKSFELADQVISQLQKQSSDSRDENVTAEKAGINLDYVKHYNLTKDDVHKALEDAQPSLAEDSNLREVQNMSDFSQKSIQSQVHSLDLGQIAGTWIHALENITSLHFNESECVDFRDCILYSVSTMYETLANDDHVNISQAREILTDLEDEILNIVQNSSFDISAIHNITTAIKIDLSRLNDLNIYCSKPPLIISTLRNVTTVPNGNATFFCKVESIPPADIWWYKGDNLLINEHQDVLIVTNVTDGYEPYRCIAGNIVANVTSNVAYTHLLVGENGFAGLDDVCQINNGGCEHLCVDVNGTSQCACNIGYILQMDLSSCADMDECKTSTHDCQQLCTNTIGSYVCSCFTGFVFSPEKRTCEKVRDICETSGLNCSQTEGCKAEIDEKPTCFCLEGYELVENGTLCKDIDECALKTSNCDQGCINTDGGYECSCHVGFFLEEGHTCIECEYPTWGDNCSQTCDCVAATTCDHVKGCVCETGWRGSKCDQDIDECKEYPGICNDTMKECVNDDGYYSCICIEGYEDTGNETCEEMKECSWNPSPCQQICIEKEDGYQCDCYPGFDLADDQTNCNPTTTASISTEERPTTADVGSKGPNFHCVADCSGMSNGDYPSCRTKHGYASCSWGSLYEMQCPVGLVWDDNLKRCDWAK